MHIPHKVARTKTDQPWVTPSIRKLINRRNRKYRQMKKTGSASLREEVKVLRHTIQRQIRRSYWSYLNSVFTEETAAGQPGKRFWTYIKKQRSSNVGVAPLKKDGHLTSNPQEQAELLNDQFQSVFGEGRQYTDEEFEQKTGMQNTDIPAMDNININCEGVRKLMKKLDPHKAGGPDGISTRVLRELATELAPALTVIFQSSLTTGQLLDFSEEITTNLESGKQTDVLVMDFAKAFDRVNHSLLIHKLRRYGFQEWERSWDMQFHPAKCVSMAVTRSRTPLSRSYVLHGHTLETVRTVKYLGVTMSHDGTWDHHINNMANKANRVLGFLRRNLKISSTSIKEKAYKAFVRPLLEYASSVWDPYTQKSIARLESVQRRAARFVLNRYHNKSSVGSMLLQLGWEPLEQRRRTQRLEVFCRIREGLVECPVIRDKIVPAPPRGRRMYTEQFTRIKTRTLYRAESFLPRTIRDWNNLHKDEVEAVVAATGPV
ncbi:uncharacterized protein [Branchiostoma lanceolatum]|uniref:uncharacterized protein n=1 Tax=Branchiostoma lanceolatum TaxID=7740 RepID=UPI003451E212